MCIQSGGHTMQEELECGRDQLPLQTDYDGGREGTQLGWCRRHGEVDLEGKENKDEDPYTAYTWLYIPINAL